MQPYKIEFFFTLDQDALTDGLNGTCQPGEVFDTDTIEAENHGEAERIAQGILVGYDGSRAFNRMEKDFRIVD